VSLYWLTDTFPRSIYPYRAVSLPTSLLLVLHISHLPEDMHLDPNTRHPQFIDRISNPQPPRHKDPTWHIKVPFGFSYFPKEILPVPKAWVAESGNLVWFRRHEQVSFTEFIVLLLSNFFEIMFVADDILGRSFRCSRVSGGIGYGCRGLFR
jgi:hypothetical protein